MTAAGKLIWCSLLPLQAATSLRGGHGAVTAVFFQCEEVKPLGQEQNKLGQAGSPLVEPQMAQVLPPRQRRGPGAGGGLTHSPALLEPRSTQTPTEGQGFAGQRSHWPLSWGGGCQSSPATSRAAAGSRATPRGAARREAGVPPGDGGEMARAGPDLGRGVRMELKGQKQETPQSEGG